MNFSEIGAFPADFLQVFLFYAFCVFSLSLQLESHDVRKLLTSRRDLWWGLASQLIIFPVLVAACCFVLFLSIGQASGLFLASVMPALALAGLLVWFARGNIALALLLVMISSITGAVLIPIMLALWSSMHPTAAQDAALLDYSPWYCLMVGVVEVLLPALAGIWLAQMFPALKKIAPMLTAICLFVSMLAPVGLIYSNQERLLANIWEHVIVVGIIFFAIICFLLSMARSLNLEMGTTKAIVLTVPTQNIAIAGLLALTGLGIESEYTLMIIWWGIFQYYGGLAIAAYLRRQ